MASTTDVVANIRINTKDVAKAAKDVLDLDKILERIDSMTVSPEFNVKIKEEFDKAKSYYEKNFSKLNLTKWFSGTTSKILDENLSNEDRTNEIKDLYSTMQKLQTLRGKIGKDTNNLQIFDSKDLERLVKSQDEIDKAEQALAKRKSAQEATVAKIAKDSSFKNEKDVIAEADKRKVANGAKVADQATQMASILGIDEEVKGKKQTMLSRYLKASGLMKQLTDEYKDLKGGDIKNVDTLKRMVQVGQQMIDTHSIIKNMEENITKTFDPDGTKNIAENLKKNAKANGFDKTLEQTRNFVGRGAGVKDPWNMYVNKTTENQRARVLKAEASQQDVIKASAERYVERSKVAERVAQQAEQKSAELHEKSQELKPAVSSADIQATKEYAVGLQECIDKIMEIQNRVDNDESLSDTQMDSLLEKQRLYYDRAQQLSKDFGMNLKDEMELNGIDVLDQKLIRDKSLSRKNQKISDTLKSGQEPVSDGDISKAQTYANTIEEISAKLRELHAQSQSKDFFSLSSEEQTKNEQDRLLYYQRFNDLVKEQNLHAGDYIPKLEMNDIKQGLNGILPEADTAKTLSILRNGLIEATQQASTTAEGYREMGAAAEEAGNKAAQAGEKAAEAGNKTTEANAKISEKVETKVPETTVATSEISSTTQPTGQPLENKEIKVIANVDEALAAISSVESKIAELPESKEIVIKASETIDIPETLNAEALTDKSVTIKVDNDQALQNIENTKSALETIPESKVIEIKSSGDSSNISGEAGQFSTVEGAVDQVTSSINRKTEAVHAEESAVVSAARSEAQEFLMLQTTIEQVATALSNMGTNFSGLDALQSLIRGLDSQLVNLSISIDMVNHSLSDIGKTKIDTSIETALKNIVKQIKDINKQKISLKIDAKNIDGIDTTFEGLSKHINSLDVSNLEKLVSIFQKLSGKNQLADNLKSVVNSLSRLQKNTGGSDFVNNGFLSDIKEIVSQGEALKNFAEVIKTTPAKMKAVKDVTKAELSDNQKSDLELAKSALVGKVKGRTPTDIQSGALDRIRAEYQKIVSSGDAITGQDELYKSSIRDMFSSVSKDLGAAYTSQYEKLSAGAENMTEEAKNALNQLLDVINAINETQIDLNSEDAITDLRELISMGEEAIGVFKGGADVTTAASKDDITNLQNRFSKIKGHEKYESNRSREDIEAGWRVSRLKEGVASVSDIKKYTKYADNLEKRLSSIKDPFDKEGMKEKLKNTFGEVEGLGSLDKITNVKADGSATLTFLREFNDEVQKTVISVKDAESAMANFKTNGLLNASDYTIEGQTSQKRKKTGVEKLSDTTEGFFDNYYNSMIGGKKFNDKRNSDYLKKYRDYSTRSLAGELTDKETDDFKKLQENYKKQREQFKNQILTRGQESLDFLGSEEGMKGKTNIAEYREELERLKTLLVEINEYEFDPLDVENMDKASSKVDELLKNLKRLESGERFMSADEARLSSLRMQGEQWAKNNSKAMKDRGIRSQMKEFRSLTQDGASVEDINKATVALNKMKASAASAGKTGLSFFDVWKNRMQSLAAYLTTFVSFYDIWNAFKQGVSVVRELDTALTEMRKVSNESLESLKQYQQGTFDTAGTIGTTAYQLQNSTADWMRLKI